MGAQFDPGRSWSAFPLPDGDPAFAVPGPLVMLVEHGPDGRGDREVKKVRFFTPDEVQELGAAIAGALTSLPAPKTGQERPRADRGDF